MRLKICIQSVEDFEFMATYGDGLGNVNLTELKKLYLELNKDIIVTAVHPPARFGYLKTEGNSVTEFGEKNASDGGWINGGFFVFNRGILTFFNENNESFENDILPKIANAGRLGAYFHTQFWQPMDTLREKLILDQLGAQIKPPWLCFD
jgi:glucose-1-phosphate cytidylyltransferase